MPQFVTNINLTSNQLQNATLHPTGTSPSTPQLGQIYTDTSSAVTTIPKMYLNVASSPVWSNVLTGSGTTNYLTYWTTAGTLGSFTGTTTGQVLSYTGSTPAFSNLVINNPGSLTYLTIASGGSLITSGAYAITLTASAASTIIMPASTTANMVYYNTAGAPSQYAVGYTTAASSGQQTYLTPPTTTGNYVLLSSPSGSAVAPAWSSASTGTGTTPVFSVSPTLTGTPAIAAATATTPSANDSSTNVATTAWVQGQSVSLGIYKVAVVAALSSSTTPANVTISNPGTATFDGVVVISGQRVLLTNQSTASQNGIWIFNGSSSALTRPVDYPASGTTQAFYSLLVNVLSGGTKNGSSIWYVSTTGAITIDTTSVAFSQFSSSTSTANITGGTAGQILYQTGPGATGFFGGASSTYGVAYTGATGLPNILNGAAGVLVGSASAIPAWSTALTGLTYNGLTVTNSGSNTLNIAASGSLITTGAFAITLSASAASTVTMPASTSAIMNYVTSAPSQYQVPYAGATSGLLTYLGLQSTAQTGFLSQTSSGAPAWITSSGTAGTAVILAGGSPTFTGTPVLAAATATTPAVDNSSTNVATTAWVQGQSYALGIEKIPVKAASNVNTNIANPGTAVFDGVTLTAGQRLLLINQTTTSQNGIWIWNASGSALTRPTDYAAGSTTHASYGVQVNVLSGGTTYGNSQYFISSTGAITIDTTGTVWTALSTSTAALATNLAGGGTNTVVYQSAANTTAFLTAVNYAALTSNSSGLPVWATATSSGGVLFTANGTTTAPAFTTAISGCTYNGLTVTSTSGTLTIANNAAAVISHTGNFAQTFTATAASTVAMPASTTAVMNYYQSANAPVRQYDLPVANAVSGEIVYSTAPNANGTYGLSSVVVASASVKPLWVAGTGTGAPVFATSPTLVTPTLGAATATSINGLVITATAGTLTVANSAAASLVTTGAFAITLAASAASTVTMPASTSAIMNYATSAPTQYQVAYAGGASGLLSYATMQAGLAVLCQTTSGTAPAFVTATGTGAPVMGTSPTISGATFTGSGSVTGTINIPSGGTFTVASGATFTSANTPVNANDIPNKGYVDTVAQGFNQKPTAKLATTAVLSPANTYSNGAAGVGATLTATGNGTLTVDGVLTALGDVILVMNEATPANNGLYTVTTAGAAGAAYVLTRSVNMDSASEFVGAFIPVENPGTANKNTLWLCTNITAPTVGTTGITFVQLNGATDLVQGTGITISGNTISLASGVVTAGGPTGSSSVVPVITYDTYGRLTAVSTSNIQLASVNISSYTTSGTGTVLALTAGPTFTGNTTVGTVNNLTISGGTATLNLVTGSSIITTGAFATTFAASATTTLTLPGASASLAYGVGTAQYQVAYFNAANASLAPVSLNTTATNKFLTQVSSGIPTWNTLTLTDLNAALSGQTITRKYTTTITGSGPTWTINNASHGMNSASMQIQVFDNDLTTGSATANQLFPDISINASTYLVTLTMGYGVPGAGKYTVVITG